MTARVPLAQRYVVLPNGCWEWQGVVDKDGYGRVGHDGRRGVPAHRAVHEILVGPIATGMTLDHLCHSRASDCAGGNACAHRRCVNPAHLEQVTSEVNSSRSVLARRTHCPAGHPYDEQNTRVLQGRRFCIPCSRRRARDSRERRLAVPA